MEERATKHDLTYAAPRILFERKHTYRTTAHLLGAIIGLGAGIAAVLFAVWLVRSVQHPRVQLVWIVPVVFCGMIAVLFYQYIFIREKLIQITEDGIADGTKFWPWQRISYFRGAHFYDNQQVTLEFSISKSMRIHSYKSLVTTPALTINEFQSLQKRIQDEIAPHYPNLTVEEKISGPLPTP